MTSENKFSICKVIGGVDPFKDDIKEKIYLEYQKTYYEMNKERLLKRQREKVRCECGRIVSRGTLASHKKTKLHERKLEERLSMIKYLSSVSKGDAVFQPHSSQVPDDDSPLVLVWEYQP